MLNVVVAVFLIVGALVLFCGIAALLEKLKIVDSASIEEAKHQIGTTWW